MKNAATVLILSGLIGFSAVGCAVTRDQSTIGEYVNDSTVTTRVKAKFAEDSDCERDVDQCRDAQGYGPALGIRQEQGREDACRSARARDPGVRQVKNDIVVRP